MATNALSVDVEEYFQVANFDGVIARERWDQLPSRVRGATERLLDAFEAHGARATFFVLGWVAERQPELIRALCARGHEVACHGHDHDLVYALGPERFRADLRRARRAIEDAAGTAVRGYRAPSFSITRESLWALQILAEEGFHYDSSIFPVRHPRYGIPGFPGSPVELELEGGAVLREFPLTTLRLGPLSLPLAGGAYLRLLPAWLFRWGFGRLARAGEPTVLYLHPWEVDAEQPRQPVGWTTRLRHYANLSRTEERVRRLLESHVFAPLGEVFGELSDAGRLPRRTLSRQLELASLPSAS